MAGGGNAKAMATIGVIGFLLVGLRGCDVGSEDLIHVIDVARIGGVPEADISVAVPPAVVWNGQFYFVVDHSVPDRVQVFDSTGDYVDRFGRTGQGPGEFAFLSGISVADDGSLWLLDDGNGRLIRVNEVGVEVLSRPLPVRTPPVHGIALASGPRGQPVVNALMTTDPTSVIHLLDHQGDPVWSIPGAADGRRPLKLIASDASGNVWVADRFGEYRIERYGTDGVLQSTWRIEREWFDEWQDQTGTSNLGANIHAGRFRPKARITGIAIRDGRVWVIGLTGDPEWQAAGRSDAGALFNSVVDVFDAATGELVTSRVLDFGRGEFTGFAASNLAVVGEAGPVFDALRIVRLDVTER